ncbi:MAG TPA: Crp/Fnr family transcriptional regulator [Xanthobacteraceae bacterium]
MDQHSPGNTNALLASLLPADFDAIAPDLQQVALPRGQILCDAGEAFDYVYFPTSGMISVLAIMQSGQAIETGVIGREGVSCSAVVGRRHALDQSMVQIEGSAARLATGAFLAAYDQSSSFRQRINWHNTAMWAMAQQSVACNALHPLERRLARWLMQSRDITGSDELSLTQEFLSMMLGVQRTTVTLAEGTLQDENLITVRRGRIRVLNPEGLGHRACECYHTLRERQAAAANGG